MASRQRQRPERHERRRDVERADPDVLHDELSESGTNHVHRSAEGYGISIGEEIGKLGGVRGQPGGVDGDARMRQAGEADQLVGIEIRETKGDARKVRVCKRADCGQDIDK